jgi:hypothetical protein
MNSLPLDGKSAEPVLQIELQRRRNAETESDLVPIVLSVLRGSVWHTTNSQRYKRILSGGAILPEPAIPDSDRWGTALGTIGCPYVRSIGGISLFDFRDFDPEEYSKSFPVSSWREFVPYRSTWGEAIWIEVDLPKVMPGFISGREIFNRWKAEQAANRFMPLIEAAHVGALPVAAFGKVLHVSRETGAVRQIERGVC